MKRDILYIILIAICVFIVGLQGLSLYENQKELEYYRDGVKELKQNLTLKEEEIQSLQLQDLMVSNAYYKLLMDEHNAQIKEFSTKLESYDWEMILLKEYKARTQWKLARDLYNSSKTIDRNELSEIIGHIKHKNNGMLTNPDETYNLYELEDIKSLFIQLAIQMPRYENETYDCDDYAWEMMVEMKKKMPGLAIAFISVQNTNESTGHTINLIVDADKKVWYAEPQTGEFIQIEDTPYDTITRIIF